MFSVGWPLLNLKDKKVDLVYDRATIKGRQLHEIEYRPKKTLGNMKVKLYFDMEAHRHVRTEYRVRVRDDMSITPTGESAEGLIMRGVPDSIYVLTETFDDFKTVGPMTLPHQYTIDYSVEGQGPAFIGKWTLQAAEWAFNEAYDERIFIAQK